MSTAKRVGSARPVIKIGSKKKQRTESKHSLKKIAEAFNYFTEPKSINMENDPIGKW
jgi:hypothetical protein